MPRCLSTYVEMDQEGYSSAALARLSDRRKFPTQLPFSRRDVMEVRAELFQEMSISGVQEKISLRLERGVLTPTAEGGEYILKPIPGLVLPKFGDEVPANESLTMQIAEQVFGITTAANALIRLADDELAYITRRFDRTRDGARIAQEDFCQLMERSSQTHGVRYKYDTSYEALAQTMKKYVPAYAIASEDLFRRIVFNYFIGNGDAHLKNFSLQQDASFGDYQLSPAYDLLCTSLHLPNETRLALDLFIDNEVPSGVEDHGFQTGSDFLELAARMGLVGTRARRILEEFGPAVLPKVEGLVERSFLSDNAQERFAQIMRDRAKALAVQ